MYSILGGSILLILSFCDEGKCEVSVSNYKKFFKCFVKNIESLRIYYEPALENVFFKDSVQHFLTKQKASITYYYKMQLTMLVCSKIVFKDEQLRPNTSLLKNVFLLFILRMIKFSSMC